ncbi:MAG: hypothetical protein C4586_02280 [Anaerolineaceae bacterium]|nr:MAG: hypothetical protein C4586_02280 [Anaerolineaceae bacterium]
MSEKYEKHGSNSDKLGDIGSGRLWANRFTLHSRQTRVVFVVAAFALYAAAFVALSPLMGLAMPSLAVLPVVVAGWHLGMRGGFLAGVLCFPLNMLLLNIAGIPGWTALTGTAGGASGTVLLIVVGGIVGRMRDLGLQARQEMTARRWAEASLFESEDKFKAITG